MTLGKFAKYEIDLKALQPGAHTYEYVLDNAFFEAIDSTEVQRGTVKVKLVVRKTSGAFELDFQTNGTVIVPCDRCLDDMEQPIASHDQLMVKFGDEYGEVDDLILVPEEEGTINVAWFMFDFVVLAIPMKHVHAAGRCNKEMSRKLSEHLSTLADDNDDDEDVEVEDGETDDVDRPIDPRWNELKKIIDNN